MCVHWSTLSYPLNVYWSILSYYIKKCSALVENLISKNISYVFGGSLIFPPFLWCKYNEKGWFCKIYLQKKGNFLSSPCLAIVNLISTFPCSLQ